MLLPFILIALCAGIALAAQAAINTQLAQSLSGQPVFAAFVSFAMGTIALFFICWWKMDLFSALQQVPKQPLWKLIGGLLGALAVFTTIFRTQNRRHQYAVLYYCRSITDCIDY